MFQAARRCASALGNVLEWNCLAVLEKAAPWVMGTGPSEGHQGHGVPPCSRAYAGSVRCIAASAVGSHAAGRTLAM